MKMPTCCEREMIPVYDTSKFVEAHCGLCGDVVYVKKEAAQKPEMLDD